MNTTIITHSEQLCFLSKWLPVSNTDRRIFEALAKRADFTDPTSPTCYQLAETLAEAVGVSVKTVYRAISKFKKLGWVSAVQRRVFNLYSHQWRGSSNLYTFNMSTLNRLRSLVFGDHTEATPCKVAKSSPDDVRLECPSTIRKSIHPNKKQALAKPEFAWMKKNNKSAQQYEEEKAAKQAEEQRTEAEQAARRIEHEKRMKAHTEALKQQKTPAQLMAEKYRSQQAEVSNNVTPDFQPRKASSRIKPRTMARTGTAIGLQDNARQEESRVCPAMGADAADQMQPRKRPITLPSSAKDDPQSSIM